MIEGFETQGFERAFSVGGSCTISTSVRSGVEGVACMVAANTSTATVRYSVYEYEGSSNSNSKAIGFWFKADSFATQYPISLFYDSADVYKGQIRLLSNGNITFQDSNNAIIAQTGASFYTANTWILLEVFFQESASGTAEFFINGTSIGSVSNADMGDNYLKEVRLTSYSDQNSYFDDLYVGECSTSADVISQQNYDGLDIFACKGDGTSSVTGSVNVGTITNLQEIPGNDTNYAGYSDPTISSFPRYADGTVWVQRT
jgi:hypothetical protein